MTFFPEHYPKEECRSLAAALTAWAVQALFSDAAIVAWGSLSGGFFCEWETETSVREEMHLPLLQQQLLAWQRENLPIFYSEMMRENAAAWFAHQNQPFRAQAALDYSKNIVPIIRFGERLEIAAPTTVTASGELGYLRLRSLSVGEGRCRVEGILFANEKLAQRFIREEAKYKKNSAKILGEKLALFRDLPGGRFWTPRGYALCEQLRHVGEEGLDTRYATHSFSPEGNPLPLLLERDDLAMSLPLQWAEWDAERADRVTFLVPEKNIEKTVISSLQFIFEKLSMYLISFRCLLNGRVEKSVEEWLLRQSVPLEMRSRADGEKRQVQIQFLFVDPLGKMREGGFLHWQSLPSLGISADGGCLRYSLWGSMQVAVDHLLEITEGNLPLGLVPEIGRLLLVDESAVSFATAIRKKAIARGLRIGCDYRSLPLKQKVHEAEKEKVPMIAVIGAREADQEKIALRVRNGAPKHVESEDFFDEVAALQGGHEKKKKKE